jgi:hypothetical protein
MMPRCYILKHTQRKRIYEGLEFEIQNSAFALSSVVFQMLNYFRQPVFNKYYVGGSRYFVGSVKLSQHYENR